MDGLKTINDTDGHEAGDNAIKAMAAALSSITRPGMDAYRFGGDEFFILAEAVDPDELTRILGDLQETSSQGFSYGVAAWPQDGEDFADVQRQSDKRMYAQKEERKRGGADIR